MSHHFIAIAYKYYDVISKKSRDKKIKCRLYSHRRETDLEVGNHIIT